MARKTKKAAAQRQPQAAHAQAVDPVNQARQEAAQAGSPVEPPVPPAGADTTPGSAPGGSPQHRLQDVLPEITNLAQRVGGMKQLAEIIATLQQAKE